LVKKYGITMEISAINPLTMSEDPNVEVTNLFIVSLNKGMKAYTRTIEFERPFSSLPMVEDVLEYLLNLMVPFLMYFENIPGLAKALRLPESDPRIRMWYEDAKSVTKDVRDTLGPEVLDELMQIKEVRGPMQMP
jgi:hypothetical protein